jgi:hypothetical protein
MCLCHWSHELGNQLVALLQARERWISPEAANVILLHGGLGAKKRREIVQRLTASRHQKNACWLPRDVIWERASMTPD